MLETLGGFIALLLVVPPLVLAAGGALLFLAALLPAGRRVRERFRCPYKGQVVTADFVVPEGAEHPTELATCTAFADPARIECQKPCRGIADVRWGLSRGVFPRWALTVGGPVAWRKLEEERAPEPAAETTSPVR